MRYNKKPYQARVLLKSIRMWQAVYKGELPAKRRLAYYKNKLSHYNQADIDYLESVAGQMMVKQGGNWTMTVNIK